MKVSDLKPAPYNPRKIGDEELKALGRNYALVAAPALRAAAAVRAAESYDGKAARKTGGAVVGASRAALLS